MKKIVKILLSLSLLFCVLKVNALEISQQEYEKYNITRAYVVGDYIFDLSKHNPTLKDFLIAGQSLPKGDVSIIEIKIAENLDGELVKEYRELLDSKKLDSFPKLDVKYIYHSEIIPDNPENETKITIGTNMNSLAKPVLAKDEETNELSSMIIYEEQKQKHYYMLENMYEDYFPEMETDSEDYCSDYDCFGIEVYSVSNNKYTLEKKFNINELRVLMVVPLFGIEMEENESKEFAIKVFLKTPTGELKYSDYSDTFTVTGIDGDLNYELPDLNIALGNHDYIDGEYHYKVNIDFSDYCGTDLSSEKCEVLSMIFEYANDNKSLTMKIPPENQLDVTLEANKDVNYFIEVLLPSVDEKYYYSVKSNQLSIKVPAEPSINVPTVELNENVELISKDEENDTETYKVTYELSNELKNYCENNSCTNVGVTLFETFDSEIYDVLDSKNLNDAFIIEIDDYIEMTLVAKVYVETNEGKIYGASSNEIEIIPSDL